MHGWQTAEACPEFFELGYISKVLGRVIREIIWFSDFAENSWQIFYFPPPARSVSENRVLCQGSGSKNLKNLYGSVFWDFRKDGSWNAIQLLKFPGRFACYCKRLVRFERKYCIASIFRSGTKVRPILLEVLVGFIPASWMWSRRDSHYTTRPQMLATLVLYLDF